MIDESPEVHITLDKEDPNASRNEIVMRSNTKLKSLVRKSDASDGLVDLQYRPNHQVDSEPHDSPHSFSKQVDFDPWMTGDKSDKCELAEALDQFHVDEPINANENKLPLVNYFVPLLVSTNSIIDIFKQTWKQQNFQIIECEAGNSTAVYREPFSFK